MGQRDAENEARLVSKVNQDMCVHRCMGGCKGTREPVGMDPREHSSLTHACLMGLGRGSPGWPWGELLWGSVCV